MVEATTGLLFMIITWFSLERHAAWNPSLAPVLLYLAAAGVALFVIDVDVQRLPDRIVLPSYLPVLGLLALAGSWSGEWPLQRAVLSLLVWFGVFTIPWLATAGRAMGFGDVKLAPLLGVVLGWVGWGPSLIGLAAGFVLALVGAILLLTAGGQIRKRAIPYGPYMLTGALAGLFVGQPAWHAYLAYMGLA